MDIRIIARSLFGRRWLQYYAAITCTIAMFISGMTYVWPSPSLPKLMSRTSAIPITKDEGSWLASFTPVGDLFGAPLAAFTADYFGRKNAILIATVPYLIHWLIIYFASSLPHLLIARFLCGFADGQILTILPMYIGEMAEYDIRGRLGNLITVMADLGTLFVYCVGPYVSITAMALLSCIFPIMVFILFYPMPDSPYYHLSKLDYLSASRSLRQFRGRDEVDEELVQLHQVVTEQMIQPSTWGELFKNKTNLKALLIVIGLKSSQQLSGISAFLVYSELIFTEAAGNIDPSISAMIFGFIQLVSSAFSAVAVDYIGRKPLLISSCIGSAVALFAQGTYFYLLQHSYDVTGFKWVPLTSMLLFIVMYCYGLGAIVFMMPSEMFPTNIKAKALCLLDLYFALTAFLVMKLFEVVSSNYGDHAPFYGFMVFTLMSIVFIVYCVPETKGKTLHEIQSILSGHESGFVSETKPLLPYKTAYPIIPCDTGTNNNRFYSRNI
ncbi:facilitated trehalose transporter Tret1-like [Chrysoperla carnea]|uniref:facilitated trehalose transporter Tret1-like n=1 Tax=Chrysoperla carnea TaxID=189513 RepID=UPI001D07D300|nr:facilitated trehalose transporter Tret1-like [Chrysoperla carnea]